MQQKKQSQLQTARTDKTAKTVRSPEKKPKTAQDNVKKTINKPKK